MISLGEISVSSVVILPPCNLGGRLGNSQLLRRRLGPWRSVGLLSLLSLLSLVLCVFPPCTVSLFSCSHSQPLARFSVVEAVFLWEKRSYLWLMFCLSKTNTINNHHLISSISKYVSAVRTRLYYISHPTEINHYHIRKAQL